MLWEWKHPNFLLRPIRTYKTFFQELFIVLEYIKEKSKNFRIGFLGMP